MIQLRRAGIALVALALPLGLSLNGGVALAHGHPPAAAKQRVDTSSIRLDTITPATIPAKGSIVLTGMVHNGSSEAWHHVTVTPETSYGPVRTTARLQAAAAFDPAIVTLRQKIPTASASLGDLSPGSSARFTLRIQRTQMNISGDSGAYWLGVVPMSDEPHSPTLTARTFLPLLPKANKKARVNLAIVVPLRENPLRSTTGGPGDSVAFATDLSPRGRLGRIAAFGQAATNRPLTWLVDPALLDLADDSAQGTGAYAVGLDSTVLPHPIPLPTASGSATSTPTGSPGATPTATTTVTPTATPSVTATKTAGATPSGSPSGGPTGSASTAALAARVTAQTWLTSITSMLLLPTSSTYSLPYADPAIAPLVATGHANLLNTAVSLSAQSMSARSVAAQPAVAPVGGGLSQSESSALPSGQTAFIAASPTPSSQSAPSAPSAPSAQSATSVTADGRTLIVASPASQGGPGPSDPTSALNLRQRILAEAALSIGQAATTDLTVILPAGWDPGSAASSASFFGQLTRPWLSFTSLPTVSRGTAILTRSKPRATPEQRANIEAALQLRTAAAQLGSALATPASTRATLARQVEGAVLSTVSYAASAAPIRYRSSATGTSAVLSELLRSVRVEGTQFVTLSGSSGVITVALHNGLNQPIRVGLRQTNQQPGSTVAVDSVAAITLDPGQRSTLRVNLTAHLVSVQEVTVTAVTSQGVPIGTPLTFTLRSSQVGAVVWALIIAIALLLSFLVARRIRRRMTLKREAA